MQLVPGWRSPLAIAVAIVACMPAAASAASCPNETLRGLAESALPDCRAYEQVSPPDKNGNDVGGMGVTVPVVVTATDGSALTFETIGDLPGSASAATFNQNLSRRGPAGWTTEPIAPPQAPRRDADYPFFQFFTPDLRQGVVRTPAGPPLAAGEVAGDINLYLRDNDTGRYTALSVATPVGGSAVSYWFAGNSRGFGHVIFESQGALTPDAPILANTTNLYELVDGHLRLVTILPDGTAAPNGGGAGNPSGASSRTLSLRHVISDDGSRIVFATPGTTVPDGSQIYLREDGSRTVEVSRSRRTSPDTPSPPRFWGASADVSKIYFTSNTALTNDAAAGSVSLYRYDTDSDTLENITANPLGSGQSLVQGVEGMSEDGSYVYFRDRSTYFPGKGVEGASNLYVLHGDTLRFIATDDDPIYTDPSAFDVDKITSRVTPDGRYLVFSTTQPLTGYDNTDAATGQPDREVFLYDAVSDSLKCVSCRPNGERPTGAAALVTVPTRSVRNPQKSVTDDGRRVFFNTSDALVPTDTNGKLDAYMYEDGSVHLISSGTNGYDSSFAGASANGDDLFFVTRERLTGTDTDSNLDVYDARVDGGFPDPQPTVPCSGDGCYAAPTPAPPLPTVASPFVLGDGNAARTVPPTATFRVAAISQTARRTAARTGVLTLSVRVSEGGILKARGSARLKGRSTTVGSAESHALRAGTARLRLRLVKAARTELSRGKTVKVAVRVSFSHVSHAKNLTLELHR
jgi:hypothetical protein